MYYLSTSCLVLFLLLSLFHPLPCASSSKHKLGWCETLFQCGNITAGFPFWGENRQKLCGHPLLELKCIKNITSIFISNQEFKVLQMNQPYNNTLTLARTDHLGSFCSSKFTNTTLPTELFELSPTYKNLTVFYFCFPYTPYFSYYLCPGLGHISVSDKYHQTCLENFTVYVPTSFATEETKLNMTNLESVLRKGFEVKVQIDENACSNESLQRGVKCGPLHPPTASELHRLCSPSFSCGNQTGLLYPFWTPGREDCGHPDFQLNCSSGFAELSISSVKFRILEANYNSRPRIIRLARSDYIGGLCPTNPSNLPFDESVLPFAHNTTEVVTIYYDCSRDYSPFPSSNVGDLGCGNDDDDRGSYYVTRNLTSPLLRGISEVLNNLRQFCGRIVSIPASGPALSTLHVTSSTENLQKALQEGFELGLNQDCSTCLDNRGACGYNQSSSGFVCYNTEEPQNRTRKKGHSTGAIAGLAAGVILFLFLVLALFLQLIRKRKTSHDLRQHMALIPLKQYSYTQVKRITKSFAEVVGKGGFGTVYRGTLSNGRRVAVKVLKDSEGNNGEDFINEVASMSQTSHINIVTLLGFCYEGSKRAILYEFVENGSLDKLISSKRPSDMDCRELYGIALGVARGLEYLHHGCRTKIVHFDIKPQNVLLDDNFCPKVADFGLAKLCEKKESILSLLDTRGTIGYIAPEVFSRMYGRVSHKSDVYSYGMLVLEMIGARNKERDDQEVGSSTSSMYFPEWIYKDLEKRSSDRLIEDGTTTNEEEAIVRKMTLVGLWCIQSSPLDRPPMNRVVEMMEGNLDALEVPPRPVLQIPPAPLLDSSTLSEDTSFYTEVCSMNIA